MIIIIFTFIILLFEINFNLFEFIRFIIALMLRSFIINMNLFIRDKFQIFILIIREKSLNLRYYLLLNLLLLINEIIINNIIH